MATDSQKNRDPAISNLPNISSEVAISADAPGRFTAFDGIAEPNTIRDVLTRAIKRSVDFSVAALVMVLLSPVLLTLALLISFDSPGPAMFRQLRRGYRGRLFWAIKFRTMVVDAEQRLHQLEEMNEAAGGILFKLRDDPRVTPLGRFLRRFNLDELPLLINVIRGEMSLVGPRPLQLRDSYRLQALDPEGFACRLLVKPGLTGPWQLAHPSEGNYARMVNLDCTYVQKQSIARDCLILLQTLYAITLQPIIRFAINTRSSVMTSVSRRVSGPARWVLRLIGLIHEEHLEAQKQARHNTIEIGGTIYPLASPMTPHFKSVPNGQVELRDKSFGPCFVGTGGTPDEALANLHEQVHVAFQRLYRKMEFEMSAEELAQWAILASAIDVREYTARLPLVLKQLGRVSRVQPSPSEIIWADDQVDRIALAELPSDFARFEPEQWFEAIVERNRVTGQLQRVSYVRPIRRFEPMPDERAEKFWEQLPTTASLPESSRSWNKA